MICVGYHPDGAPEATGRVRYVDLTGREHVSDGECDACQVEACTDLRVLERQGQIREVGAIPLDYRERTNEAKRFGFVRRIGEEIERHPGTQEEIAADLVTVLTRLYGVPSLVRDRLQRWESEQDEARATMLADVDPEDVF